MRGLDLEGVEGVEGGEGGKVSAGAGAKGVWETRREVGVNESEDGSDRKDDPRRWTPQATTSLSFVARGIHDRGIITSVSAESEETAKYCSCCIYAASG